MRGAAIQSPIVRAPKKYDRIHIRLIEPMARHEHVCTTTPTRAATPARFKRAGYLIRIQILTKARGNGKPHPQPTTIAKHRNPPPSGSQARPPPSSSNHTRAHLISSYPRQSHISPSHHLTSSTDRRGGPASILAPTVPPSPHSNHDPEATQHERQSGPTCMPACMRAPSCIHGTARPTSQRERTFESEAKTTGPPI